MTGQMDPVIVISELQLTCYSLSSHFCALRGTLWYQLFSFSVLFSHPVTPLSFCRLPLMPCLYVGISLTLNQLSTTGYADVCRCSRDL
jgi:hypothetical protein